MIERHSSLNNLTLGEILRLGRRACPRYLIRISVAVVLLEFSIKGFATNAECAGGMSFIAFGVIKGSLNRLPFDFIHRRGHSNFKRCRTSFAGSASAFHLDAILFL